ncbi:hypothetical protein HNY73_008147 [Argiope bruennichi]|uniref:Uncharacterized protein n=1 Tax=Argiope bruennichi TaxID=94029 RepID=A0A8T0F7R1_ARGBR|nr:hypothetical protein HNY73_008147 [Argiope bruennichi]
MGLWFGVWVMNEVGAKWGWWLVAWVMNEINVKCPAENLLHAHAIVMDLIHKLLSEYILQTPVYPECTGPNNIRAFRSWTVFE